jgi:hypothetical protein
MMVPNRSLQMPDAVPRVRSPARANDAQHASMHATKRVRDRAMVAVELLLLVGGGCWCCC